MKQKFSYLIKNCNDAIEEYAKFKLQEFKDSRLKIAPIPDLDEQKLYQKYAVDKYDFLKDVEINCEFNVAASDLVTTSNAVSPTYIHDSRSLVKQLLRKNTNVQ